MTKAILSILLCGLLAGCVANAPGPARAARDLSGTKLEFTDLHSANSYQFIPGGRYRFTAVSQNRLQTDRREGTFTCKGSGRAARIVLDNQETLRLTFENDDRGVCRVDGDVRPYRFRLVDLAKRPRAEVF